MGFGSYRCIALMSARRGHDGDGLVFDGKGRIGGWFPELGAGEPVRLSCGSESRPFVAREVPTCRAARVGLEPGRIEVPEPE